MHANRDGSTGVCGRDTAVSIEYRDDSDVDLEALSALRDVCRFAKQPLAVIAQQVTGARWTLAAYEDGMLVGFARAISDGVTNAYVSSVMVHPDHRRQGIGRELLGRLMDGRDGI